MRTPIHRLMIFIALLSCCFTLQAQPASNPDRINGELISPDFPYQSRFVDVLGSKMHYIDEGEGEVVLFIHGNPTSSYLWRNVIPHVAKNYRAIAIDLIGMGKSDKPDIGYTYLEHRDYVFGLIKALGLEHITLVIHDWGSVLGTDYAMQHPDNVAGIAFMEPLLPPSMPFAAEAPPQSIFGQFRSDAGEQLVLEDNYFVEQMIPGAVVRELREAEMDAYRAPYPDPPSRKPTLMWPRELPMGGNPPDTTAIIEAIGEWMKQTDIPMLYFYGTGRDSTAEYYVNNLHNVETVFVGEVRHYLQEDRPETIGRAIHDWRRRIE